MNKFLKSVFPFKSARKSSFQHGHDHQHQRQDSHHSEKGLKPSSRRPLSDNHRHLMEISKEIQWTPAPIVETMGIEDAETVDTCIRRINQYDIATILGEGSMATVFLISSLPTDKETDDEPRKIWFAMKEISKSKSYKLSIRASMNSLRSSSKSPLSQSQNSKAQAPSSQKVEEEINIIKNEIDIMRSINGHPNICRLHEVIESRHDDSVYLITEYCPHGPLIKLSDLFHSTAGLKMDKCRRYLTQFVQAVAFLHSQLIYHRDLKPDNLVSPTTQSFI